MRRWLSFDWHEDCVVGMQLAALAWSVARTDRWHAVLAVAGSLASGTMNCGGFSSVVRGSCKGIWVGYNRLGKKTFVTPASVPEAPVDCSVSLLNRCKCLLAVLGECAENMVTSHLYQPRCHNAS